MFACVHLQVSVLTSKAPAMWLADRLGFVGDGCPEFLQQNLTEVGCEKSSVCYNYNLQTQRISKTFPSLLGWHFQHQPAHIFSVCWFPYILDVLEIYWWLQLRRGVIIYWSRGRHVSVRVKLVGFIRFLQTKEDSKEWIMFFSFRR